MGMRDVAARKQPIQRRSQETVDAILAAAERLIAERSIDRISTNAIAKASHVSIGSLYNFFPNKEAIYFELADRWLSRIRASLAELHPANSELVNWMQWIDELAGRTDQHYRDQPGLARNYDILRSIPELRTLNEEHDAWVLDNLSTALSYFGFREPAEAVGAQAKVITTLIHSLLVAELETPEAMRVSVRQSARFLLHSLMAQRFSVLA